VNDAEPDDGQEFDFFDAIAELDDRPKPVVRQPIPGSSTGPNFNPSIDDPRTRGAVKAAFRHAFDNIVNARTDGGGRNNMLNTEAFNLGQLVANELVTQQQVYDHLMQACVDSGLLDDDGESQCRASLMSGLTDGIASGPRINLPKMDPTQRADYVRPPRIPVSKPGDDGEPVDPASKDAKEEPVDWKTVPGGAFILDVPLTIPTVWGADEGLLWVEGESLMIAGGQGLGKTTLAGQMIRAQVRGGEVLALPMRQLGDNDRILYLAMDRPRQIARSLARQFTQEDRQVLNDKLVVRPGPPMADLAANPSLLTLMAQALDCNYVYVDSLKDAAVGLVDDEIAAKWNRARQTALSENIQLCELHHNKKHKSGDNWDISDVYGSNWITAGLGSIVMLTGDPGDPIIGFRHIKQPSEEIGPFRLEHDQKAGTMIIHHDVDLVTMARAAGPEGLTARGAAAAIFDTETPSRGEVEKARRRLDKLVDKGWLIGRDPAVATGRGHARTWFPIAQVVDIHAESDERNWA